MSEAYPKHYSTFPIPEHKVNEGSSLTGSFQAFAHDNTILDVNSQFLPGHVPFRNAFSLPNTFENPFGNNLMQPTTERMSASDPTAPYNRHSLDALYLGTIITVNTTPPSLVIKSEIDKEIITAFGFSHTQLQNILECLGKGAGQVSYKRRQDQHGFYAADVHMTGFVDHERWKNFDRNFGKQCGQPDKQGGVNR